MKQCKCCLWYKKKFDKEERKRDKENEQTYHYCCFFYGRGKHIPPDIINDKIECLYFLKTNHFDYPKE